MESSPPIRQLVHRTNFAGFDFIRAFAALGVVMLHACIPYLANPMPGLAWPLRDTSSPLVNAIGWTIELFIMPLFLVLAGFLAWQTLQRRGAGGLILGRGRRLLIPFFFGCLVILPLELHIWVMGWVIEGLVEPVKLKSFKFDGGIDRDLWGTSHLWFLQYLFLYVLTLGCYSWLVNRHPRSQRSLISAPVLAAGMFVIGSVTLAINPRVVWGFQHWGLPITSKWIYSGLFFATGVVLAARDPGLNRLSSAAHRLVVPSLLLAVIAVGLGCWHLSGGERAVTAAIIAAPTFASAITISLAIIACCVRHLRTVPTSIQYLSAASFWIYLVHHPLLGLIHIDLKLLLPRTSPEIKMLIAFVVASAVSLLLYEGCARSTSLGRLLGFSWEIRKTQVSQSPADRKPAEGLRRAA